MHFFEAGNKLLFHCKFLSATDMLLYRDHRVKVERIKFQLHDNLYEKSFYCAIKPGGKVESEKHLI